MHWGGNWYDGSGWKNNPYQKDECQCPARSKHFEKDKNLHEKWCPAWRHPITGKKAKEGS